MNAIPVVTIIGVPNTGKSTLFNRILGKRKALVHNLPGMTRDIFRQKVRLQRGWVDLQDSGGFFPDKEIISAEINRKIFRAAENSELIIFLFDGKRELLGYEKDLYLEIKKLHKKIIPVLNKADRMDGYLPPNSYYELKADFIPISAEHNLGVENLLDEIDRCLENTPKPAFETEAATRISIIGKPNVGKSSLINLISGSQRSIANPTPGTTRDAIDTTIKVHGRHYLLIDTAGIRRKNKISLTLEKYSVIQALKTINRCDIALVLIDAEEGMTEQDAKIVGLAYERGKACIIVVNKWDKIEKDNATVGKFVEDIKDKIKFMDFAPILFISALTGQRAPKIFELINDVYSQYTKRVDTSPLNDLVERSVRRNPMARFQNRSMSISYATQTGIKPPTFIFFVPHAKGIHFSYERYLMNSIRSEFGFDKVPLKLIFRKKR